MSGEAVCVFGCGATQDELRVAGHRGGCRGALIECRAELRRVIDSFCERDDEWRDASGLTKGGDPGGVEPETLRSFVGKVDDLERAANQVKRAAERRGLSGEVADAVHALSDALLAMPKED